MGETKNNNNKGTGKKKDDVKEVAAAPAIPAPLVSQDGAVGIDIRLFLLALTVAMSAAFFAGVSLNLQSVWEVSTFGSSSLLSLEKKKQTPRALQLSPVEIAAPGAHSPSGQHLLVDIEGIEAAFLDSEERLANAMVQTVNEAGLTMLSYHCHKLDPAGISCVGVLLESHISFHTWPEEGVITLDLFTCGPNPLLPVVSVIVRLFGIPRPGEEDKINPKWSHELRGFRSDAERQANYLDEMSDLAMWVLSPSELYSKKEIYSNLTKFQRVDIWDVAEPEDEPSYEDGIKHNLAEGDPRWKTPEYYTPDRFLFLDGTIQSLYSSEATYHEALVHPVMFSHPNPKHVLVLGGGEGATLREVLKHNTLEQATMIEIDAEMIEIAREYLPIMSDCSMLIGRADNCFDDEKANVVNDNGLLWFIDRYGPNPKIEAPEKPFDVLIVDALDPEDDDPLSRDLYADGIFVSAMLKSMADDGVLIVQIGTAPELRDPKPDVGMYQIRESLFNIFEAHPDVASMHVFEEPKSGFLEPHSFLVVCKDIGCRGHWYARSDAIDFAIHDRLVKTKSGVPALKFYDGTVQYTYQVPPKAWETVYCRREPMPFECAYRSLDFTKEVHEFYLEDEEKGSFNIRFNKDEHGEVVGSALFAKVDIPKGSYIMPDHLSRSFVLKEESVEDIEKVADMGESIYQDFKRFVAHHAHKTHTDGVGVRFLEVGATVLIRNVATPEEANVDRWLPPHPAGKRPSYSPVYDRHRMSFDVFMVATKDIPAGTELTRYEHMWSTDMA